ncbi:CRISPR-associated protein Cas4 [[Phormidium] sp. ETS-05]|uniref:CRISPR-associated protein Cas4 n=1 Tax=[Phormidium] sp. ETS-05 TaxID=222819 RepID=UPI0018EEFD43|nr:CRISPR-associated protein Cas4 [[Phormidium] sp. ETS-05]
MLDIDYIPIAALNQYAYCSHRCWRMFCAGEFVDNHYTIEGTSLHSRVHSFGEGIREDVEQIRAIWLKSEQYKLIGKSDLIETVDGEWYPVEYKRGRKGEWDNDELQVAAQALCLEEMTGKTITGGYIYYASSYQRQLVEISPELRGQTLATIAEVAKLFATGAMPKPTYNPRCRGCSLSAACLPQAAAKIGRYQELN